MDDDRGDETSGPLTGIRVLDLSRVLAGPSCTQLLGDLGAEVIKVERPGVGDETRTWGPPYVTDTDGADTTEAAYYLSANRNKRSVAIDMSQPEGADLVKRLLEGADVLIENFKVGGLAKYGLAYDDLKADFPGLVYCSITGFGQTGPYAARPGYDMMAQGAGGLISMTGEPGRPPVKVPIAINDVITGMYAAVAILAALRHRDATGRGQHIDLGLLDVQVAWLFNQGLNYLTGGIVPERMGTAHPNTVPYQAFETSDGFIILACNNDGQFERFCTLAGRTDLLEDERFASNPARVRNREFVTETVARIIKGQSSGYWIDELEKVNVSCCPINTLDQVFRDPQVLARDMVMSMAHPLAGKGAVDLIANPIKMSDTPPRYRRPPPTLGQHTDEVLAELLDLDAATRDDLRARRII